MVGLLVDNKLERPGVKVILPNFKVPAQRAGIAQLGKIQGDQKVSVHLMITAQKTWPKMSITE
jgi:hypothetical protein